MDTDKQFQLIGDNTMVTVDITVNHNGKAYEGKIVTISEATLGFEDYGLMPVIRTDCVDLPGLLFGKDAEHLGPWLVDFLRTVGAGGFERLKGTKIMVLFEGNLARGVAGLTTDKVMVWDEWFDNRRLTSDSSTDLANVP